MLLAPRGLPESGRPHAAQGRSGGLHRGAGPALGLERPGGVLKRGGAAGPSMVLFATGRTRPTYRTTQGVRARQAGGLHGGPSQIVHERAGVGQLSRN